MGLDSGAWKEARATIQNLLSANNTELRDNQELRSRALVPISKATMHLPAQIGRLMILIYYSLCFLGFENLVLLFDWHTKEPSFVYGSMSIDVGRICGQFLDF